MEERNFCVILAGGVGTKLWPASTHSKPKQFIDLLGTGQSLLQNTYKRVLAFVKEENIIVSTNEDYESLVREQLPQLGENNLLLEPMRRNTLPSATWATLTILHREPEARVLIMPSDQMITDERQFEEDVLKGFEFVANSDRILTMGIMPVRPDVNYGYIQMDRKVDDNIFTVKSFAEKPEEEFAKLFVEDKSFLWNTGIFIWKAKAFTNFAQERETEMPSLDISLKLIGDGREVKSFIEDVFSKCTNTSIEQVCLEYNDNTDVMLCRFGWTDLGSWQSMFLYTDKDKEDNAVMGGQAFLYECRECLVKLPKDHIFVGEGLEDYIVVEDNNVLLICRKDSQNIRRFVNDIQLDTGEDFL